MRAEIVSIGTEILLGEIVDTNSAYVASRLPALGIDVYYKHVVGDNLGRIVEVFRLAWSRSDLIITTGGLGPTEDDLTREGIAALMGEQTAIDPELEEALRSRYRTRGTAMPERNIKQAWLIPSARAIPNPRGTAPGWWVEKDGKIVVSMPGPPAEMTRMWDEEVAPELLKRSEGTVLVKRTLKTAGLGESNVDEILSPLLKTTNPSIGIYARADGVHVRIAAKAPSPVQADALIAPVEVQVRQLLTPNVWGADDDTFESVIGDMLKARGLTLASMESCTGGLFADTITNVPGSSAYFRGSIVSYATEVKELMGVDPAIIGEHGVVSQQTANAMAQAVRGRLQADIGVGITGVAGPDSQDGVPVGQVYIAVANGEGPPDELSLQYPQSRTAIKRRAVTQAILLLYRSLVE
jgi:competence/damage-inducible protein CinA-like protein